MTVASNTGQTYDFNTIREDLENVVYKISPLECPVMQSIGRKGEWENTLHEWPIVELAAPSSSTARVEGDEATVDAPTEPFRMNNYSQINTKVKFVSSTNDAVRGAGDVQKMAKQVLYGTQEIKRDIEKTLTSDGTRIAAAGSASTARNTASIAAFISPLFGQTSGVTGGTMTNVTAQSTGYAAGAFSGASSGLLNGHPSTAETPGTSPVSVSGGLATAEKDFKLCIQGAWSEGGNPTYAFAPGGIKVSMSGFTGNATRYKHAEDRKLVASIDVYESDFGQLQIVPSRFMVTDRVLILDPGYAEIGWLQPMKNEPLAKTGLSTKRMVSCEWGVVVGNPKAHGMWVGIAP